MSLRVSIFGLLLCMLLNISLATVHADVAVGNTLHTLRPDVEPEDLDVLSCYEEAVQLEQEIAQMYREIRAAKLSEIQRQSLKQSLRQTLLPISSRLEPKQAVLNMTAQSGEDVTAYQEELKRVMQESDAIVSNAEEMLRSLLPQPVELLPEDDEAQMDSVEGFIDQAMSELLDPMELEASALEETANEQMQTAVDSLETALEEMSRAQQVLSEDQGKEEEPMRQVEVAMDRIETVIEALAATGEDAEALREQTQGALSALEKAVAQAEAVDQSMEQISAVDAKQHTGMALEMLQKAQKHLKSAEAAAFSAQVTGKPKARTAVRQQQVLEELSRAESGRYLDITAQMKGEHLEGAAKPVSQSERPPPIAEHFKGIAGRKFVKQGGQPAVWSYVNKWYILGPYDNAGRMNIKRVFPPESIIDLNAHYLGKGDANLTWVYDSFAEEMVIPSSGRGDYTIFYGYTELYFEEASDVWVAIGSDDRSDVWINNMPVWHSRDQLKMWQIGEGYRKVHFKAGRNKVVFRLENGWRDLGFSLLIHQGP